MPKSVESLYKAGRELLLSGARTCNTCHVNKRAERFYPSNPYKCKDCFRRELRNHRREHPEIWPTYQRKHTLKRLYGITPEQYEQMVKDQNGKCAICGSSHVRRRGVNNFAIDHDHVTGQIRGLLCHNCNRGLGHFKDSEDLLSKAILYVKRYEVKYAKVV